MNLIPRYCILFCVVLLAGCVALPAAPMVESDARHWQTWVVTDVAEVRPPAPPDQAATQAELQEVKTLVAGRDEDDLQQIAYWDAGSPSYRWLEVTFSQLKSKPLPGPRTQRLIALVNVAIYDALVATWDAKYTYWSFRPHQMEPKVTTIFPVPNYPSYPSGHACVSTAISAVIADQFPVAADTIRARVSEALESRIWAGIHFRHEIVAGRAIGLAVAQRVLEHAMQDGAVASR